MLTTLTPMGGGNGSGMSAASGGDAADMFVYVSEAVIIPVILAIGVISNCFSLMILPRASIAPAFKTCLLALTVSDLFAGLVGFLQMMVEVVVFQGHIQWGVWDPWAVTSFSLYYIFSWCICTSSAIVIAIVAIRHYTISKPVSAKLNITSRTARVICLCLCVGTLIIFLPTILMVLWQSCHRETSYSLCVRLNEAVPNLGRIALTYLLLVTVLYGPVLVLVCVCCMIGIRINLGRTEQILESLQEDKSGSSFGKSRRKNTMRITKTLLLILLLDTICCLPLVVQAFAMVIAPKKTVFSTTNTEYRVFDAIAEIFLVMRQAYNFWLYAFSHQSFRQRAKTLFLCLCIPKYRKLWKSPSSQYAYRGRPDRQSSTNTSGRLHSVDMDTTDATWIKAYERKGLEEKGGRRDSGRSYQKPLERMEDKTLLNGQKEKAQTHSSNL